MKLLQAMEGLIGEEFISDSAPAPQLTPVYQMGLHDVVLAQQSTRLQEQATLSQDALHQLAGSGEDLERVRQAVQTSSTDNQISTESYLFADLASRAAGLGSALNLQLGPTMEALAVSGDRNVTVSTEGMSDFLKRVGEGIVDLGRRYAAEFQRSLSFTATRLTIARSSLITVASRARHMRPAGNLQGVTVRANTRKLHRDGEMPEDYARYINEVCDVLDFFTTRFQAALTDAIRSNARQADALRTTDDSEFEASFNALGAKWKDPRQNLTDAQLTMPMPGGRRLFLEGEARYTGDNNTMKTLDWTVNRYPLARINQQYTGVINTDNQAQALQPAQVSAAAERLVRSLDNVSRLRLVVDSFIAGTRTATSGVMAFLAGGAPIFHALVANGLMVLIRTIRTPALPGGRRHPKEIGALKRAMGALAEMETHAYFDASALLVSVAAAFAAYSKASLDEIEVLSK